MFPFLLESGKYILGEHINKKHLGLGFLVFSIIICLVDTLLQNNMYRSTNPSGQPSSLVS